MNARSRAPDGPGHGWRRPDWMSASTGQPSVAAREAIMPAGRSAAGSGPTASRPAVAPRTAVDGIRHRRRLRFGGGRGVGGEGTSTGRTPDGLHAPVIQQRFGEHAIQVHGGRRRTGPVHGLIDRGQKRRRIDAVVRHRQVEAPCCGAAEQVGLVDRLVGAGVAQLRGPVGGQQKQRHAAQARLHRGRQQVGAGRAGSADYGGGNSGGPRGVDGLVAGGTLVDADRHLQLGRAGGRGRERSGAGAGTDPRGAATAADQLVDDQLAPQAVPHGCGQWELSRRA